jgi:hypothetical protein
MPEQNQQNRNSAKPIKGWEPVGRSRQGAMHCTQALNTPVVTPLAISPWIEEGARQLSCWNA